MAVSDNYERMRNGEPFINPDFELIAMQDQARAGLDRYNQTRDFAARGALLTELLGSFDGTGVILSPVTWEFGKHIHLGSESFVNCECLFLDGADIYIGALCAIGPRVQFLTASHPVDPKERLVYDDQSGELRGVISFNKAIHIGEACWIGAGTIILGGVTIGEGTTIGAGSVVTRDIPAGVIAAGNPCRVIREIRR